MLEEMTLNTDGSGNYILRYDLSDVMSDPTMREMVQSSMSEEEDGMSELDNMDTIMSIYHNLGPSVENRDFWKKVNIHMVMNSASNEYKIDFVLKFTDVADVAYMYENLSSVSTEGESIAQMSSMLPALPKFSLKKNTLSRESVAQEQDMGNDEEMAMVEMFLSSAKYTCIYHLPGQVSKVSIPKAKNEGNTVIVENSLLDAMKGDVKLDGTIKYK